MKRCPKCNAEYDNTWEVCLKCNIPLLDLSDPVIIPENIGTEFQKIGRRLDTIERALGIETAPKEQFKASEVIKNVEIKAGVAAKAPSTPKAAKGDIESKIGLVWLNRIGIFALLLGVAFFLKYAFDNRWISELGRVVIGLMTGFGMIFASEITRKRGYDVMSQGFHGGGVAIMYLSIFSAFGFYHLIGRVPAFLFMAVVTAYCGFWSIRTGWVSSAVMGIIGGFLTPFLIGTGSITPSLLFIYVILLDAGVLYISLYKKWRALNIGSFVFTQAIYFNWFSSSYSMDKWFFGIVFAALFFAIFSLLGILHNLLKRETSDAIDIMLILANGLIFFGALFGILKPFAGGFPAILPLGLSCIYIGYSYSALARCNQDDKLVTSYVGLAVLFATIAIPVQLRYSWVSISWALEALLLVWLGFRLEQPSIRKIGLFVGAISVIKYLFMDYAYYGFYNSQQMFLLNEKMFNALVIAVSSFVAAWFYRMNKDKTTYGEKPIATFLVLMANVLLLFQLSAESQRYFANSARAEAAKQFDENSLGFRREMYSFYSKTFSARQLSMSILWIIYALASVAIGISRRFRALRIMALVLFGAAIVKIFLMDLSGLDKIYRIISFVSLGVVLIIASFFYQKYRDYIKDFAMKD